MSTLAVAQATGCEALLQWRLSALAGLILAENLFPPLPSELILPLAGFYVGTGEMAFVQAVLAATLGSVVGALILYGIARYGGRR